MLWNSHMTSLQTITTQYFISLPFFMCVYYQISSHACNRNSTIATFLLPLPFFPISIRLPIQLPFVDRLFFSILFFIFHSHFYIDMVEFATFSQLTRELMVAIYFYAFPRLYFLHYVLCFFLFLHFFTFSCSCCSFHVCTCVHEGILSRVSAFSYITMGVNENRKIENRKTHRRVNYQNRMKPRDKTVKI